jgi:selenocysteine lyase/cysteine desulfurase
MKVFSGPHQSGTVSFIPRGDCEEMGEKLARRGIAVRAGIHCAPLAHESAGTLQTGTLRVSFGHDVTAAQMSRFLREMAALS